MEPYSEKEPSAAVKAYLDHTPAHIHPAPGGLEALYNEAAENFNKLLEHPLYIFAQRVVGNRGSNDVSTVLAFAAEDFAALVSKRAPSKKAADVKLAMRFSLLEATRLLLKPAARTGLEHAHAEFRRIMPTITIEAILVNDNYNQLAAEYTAYSWAVKEQVPGSKSTYSQKGVRNDTLEMLKQTKEKISSSLRRGNSGAALLSSEEEKEINLL